ncbi:MAG: asparagine synthase-related protein [Nitrososphaera sp.]|nr:asparagine synthase-related protein [Nitrososphaera sp.]
MSGICGFINFDGSPANPEFLREMAEAAAHYGLDGINYWIDNQVGLAHLALQITPESIHEHQPLISADKLFCLVADARIDNRSELVSSLATGGYLVADNPTDPDLILAAYLCWGEHCPLHIIGDFAFALWDGRNHKLLCARDALGIKPLFYSLKGGVLCIATEAQQILHHPIISNEFDEVKIADFLAGNLSEESRTYFKEICRLPAAHCLIASAGDVRIERYWDIDPAKQIAYERDEEYADHFLELFQRVVADHLRSHTPAISIMMSGGLDSSSIAAVAHQDLHHSSRRLIAHSLVYNELKPNDERAYIQAIEKKLDIAVNYVSNDNLVFFGDLSKLDLDSPYIGWESTVDRLLYASREQGARILLHGVGGDELLAGTPLVYYDQLQRGRIVALKTLAQDTRLHNRSFLRVLYSWYFKPRLPIPLRQIIKRRGRRRKSSLPPWISVDLATRTNLCSRLSTRFPIRYQSAAQQRIYESALIHIEVQREPLFQLQRQAARLSMEIRFPMLDRRLYEFVLSIPPDQLWRNGFSKYLLRRAMHGILPEEIRLRYDKTLYRDVINNCLQKESQAIEQLLANPLSAKLGYVDIPKLFDNMKQHLANPNDDAQMLGWLMRAVYLEIWLKHHLH